MSETTGHRRRTIDELLAAARARLDRVEPADLADEMERGALVIDIRDSAARARYGELPGAHVVEMTVLEWRLAPSSDTRTFDITAGQKVILMCNEGFASSLAAARLQDLGVEGATDLVGGYEGWKAAAERRGAVRPRG